MKSRNFSLVQDCEGAALKHAVEPAAAAAAIDLQFTFKYYIPDVKILNSHRLALSRVGPKKGDIDSGSLSPFLYFQNKRGEIFIIQLTGVFLCNWVYNITVVGLCFGQYVVFLTCLKLILTSDYILG